MRRMMKLALLPLLVVMLATSAPAAGDLAPQLVLDDPAGDHALYSGIDPGATPPIFDLKGAYIGESDKTIDFVWEYWDIPDGSGGLFEGNFLYWDFALDDNDGIDDSVLFQLSARPSYPMGLGVHVHYVLEALPAFRRGIGIGPGGASLASNCTNTSNVISCTTVPGSIVTVSVDDIANTVTAKVRRLDLRDASDSFIAVDGSKLTEVDIFDGISACQGFLVITSANCDPGDMLINVDEETGAYVLGQPR